MLRLHAQNQEIYLDDARLSSGSVLRIRENASLLRPEGFLIDKWIPSNRNIENALRHIASEQTFYPIRDYLNSLSWDGTARINKVASDVLKVDSKLHRTYIRKFMVGAVARAMTPGCKLDTVIILVGIQGLRKSTFFSVLGGPFYCDSPIDMAGKDGMQLLGQAWIYEMPELDSLSSAKTNRAKGFLTSSKDVFRPAYTKEVIHVPRSSIIVGTTNDDSFLSDPTGDRRFWVVNLDASTEMIDTDKLLLWRDQLWAEAVVLWKGEEDWWLTDEEQQLSVVANAKYREIDPWLIALKKYTEGKSKVIPRDFLVNALCFPERSISLAMSRRVGRCFKMLGWTASRSKDSRFFIRPKG